MKLAGKVLGLMSALYRPPRLAWLLALVLCLASCAVPPSAAAPAQSSPNVVIPPPSDQLIRYAVFPAPPYMIGVDEPGSTLRGIDVDIVQEIARRLEREVFFVRCSWARCLELMKVGDVDLLSSAYKKPEREAYMLYFSQPFLDKLPIAFYTLKEKQFVIDAYEDIHNFETVGVLQGAAYFEQFDNDPKINRYEVVFQDQLFPMLLEGRLDAIAGYVPTEDYRIQMEGYAGKVERSAYVYEETALVYMTISKESPVAAIFDQVDAINSELVEEGFIQDVVERYYEEFR